MSSTDRAARARFNALAASLLGVAVASCASTPPPSKTAATPPGFVKDARTPLDQYAIAVDSAPDLVALSVHPSGLSARQRSALQAFTQRWRDAGGSQPVVVQTPRNSAEPSDPGAAAVGVAALLNALGVPPLNLRVIDYDAGGRPGAPVTVRYERFEAKGPDCLQGWDNLSSTNKNRPSTHFGCANAANLAALVADPHDLEHPAPTAPADSVRRAIILDKYRQGVVTSAAKDDQASGVVSQVGRN